MGLIWPFLIFYYFSTGIDFRLKTSEFAVRNQPLVLKGLTANTGNFVKLLYDVLSGHVAFILYV